MKQNIFLFELKIFFRNTSSITAIVILLLAGFIGLYFGKTFIERQDNVIQKAVALQKENTAKNYEHFGEDTGLFFFHNKFSVANTATKWAAFSNGQRDINPYLISVTMLGLEGQIYDTDIANPSSLLMGNIDLGFVFIFLFPLVIIALSYNILSSQQENGVWILLKSQTSKPHLIIWNKLLVRVLVIFATAFILMIAALFYLNLDLDSIFFSIFGLVLLYLIFWFAAVFFIISFGKTSNFNASSLIGLWVGLAIVVPASLNLYLTAKYPVPEALKHVMEQRQGYHEKWDLPKNVTMDPFFKHYPHFRQFPFDEKKTFSWFWYYGMQQMGDDQALESRKAMEQKLENRQQFASVVALFFPTIQTQLSVNSLSGSDLKSHLDFQNFVRDYHEKVRLHFYPEIFQDKKVSLAEVEKFGLKHYENPVSPLKMESVISLILLDLILLIIGNLNFRRLFY